MKITSAGSPGGGEAVADEVDVGVGSAVDNGVGTAGEGGEEGVQAVNEVARTSAKTRWIVLMASSLFVNYKPSIRNRNPLINSS